MAKPEPTIVNPAIAVTFNLVIMDSLCSQEVFVVNMTKSHLVPRTTRIAVIRQKMGSLGRRLDIAANVYEASAASIAGRKDIEPKPTTEQWQANAIRLHTEAHDADAIRI